jgi:hypothetical protein
VLRGGGGGGFAERVERFLERLVADLAPSDPEDAQADTTDWTLVYLDTRFYVRLVPGHMDLEATGYPHGLAIKGEFALKPEAQVHAEAVEAEMKAMVRSFLDGRSGTERSPQSGPELSPR